MAGFKNLITIDKGKTCSYALRLMDKNKISRLVVVDKDRIIGIVTYLDIMNALNNPKRRKLSNARIRVVSAMTKNVITVKSSSSAKEIADIMLKNKISSVIIENEGIITKTDLIKLASNADVPIYAIYTKTAITIPSTSTIVNARKIMEKNEIHRLLVVDKEDNYLTGIITEKDIAHALKLFRDLVGDFSHPNIKLLKVSDFMKRDLKILKRKDYVKDAVKLMIEYNISGIPIINEDNTFGIITKTDIVRGIKDGIVFTNESIKNVKNL